jgi:hypothetical protein
MERAPQAAAIRGKTIRLVWTKGPTAGTTYEHVFRPDGTVEWHDVKSGRMAPPKETPAYGAFQVTQQVYAVSYLAPSGYTLTVVLNFQDQKMVGFASSAKDWHPVEGRFEVVSGEPGT